MINLYKTARVCLAVLCAALMLPYQAQAKKKTDNSAAAAMEFKAATIAQWAKDNEHQIAQLKEQFKTNDIMQKDMTAHYKDSWLVIKKLNDRQIKILSATHSLADEMEKGSAYLLSKRRSEVLKSCLSDTSCVLRDKLASLDDAAALQSKKAILNAREVKNTLKDNIAQLSKLSLEAHDAKSRADVLDTLSKINSQSSSSLLNLNEQFASVVEFLSLENIAKLQDKNVKKVMSQKLYARKNGQEPHFELNLKNRMH